MPRLPPSLFWRARREISPMAALLLPACRDLQSTANELRWIREYVQDTDSPIPDELRVWKLVGKRGKGIPLQYVLGTQPFGDLEIKCRPGVLIPRPETEAYTLHVASLIAADKPPPQSLSILDLCTGTGCIPLLLLHSLLNSPTLSKPSARIPIQIHGIDISPLAISLARANYTHNTALNHLPPPSPSSSPYTLSFSQHDIFSSTLLSHITFHLPSPAQEPQPQPDIDLLTANPPYISPSEFSHFTARSVHNHEPRLALVPPPLQQQHRHYACEPEDIFYARLLEIASELRPKRVLMEVGGWEQALRVVGLVQQMEEVRRRYGTVEVWRDEPAAGPGSGGREETVDIGGRKVVVRGEGKGRAVYLSRV